MLSTFQKTRLLLNYIHKQMYSISQRSWAHYSQSFLRLPDREGRPCQAMQGGSQDTWQDWVEHYCKWYRFFLFFTNQIALIIKWLHHSTELLQMLTRKWQLSEFLTISIWRCWLQFLFTLIHFKMRVSLCLHVFFYLILKIKFGTKLTKAEIQKKPPKFSNTCYK